MARLLPAAAALLLLAAHFVRAGGIVLASACLLLVALLAVARVWSARIVQTALTLGVLVWLRTAWTFAAERRAAGEPSARLWAILGTVAVFTGFAAWLLGGRIDSLRRRAAI